MAEVPKTSTTLLKALAVDAQHARWGEFVARYRPLMESYMREPILLTLAYGVTDEKILLKVMEHTSLVKGDVRVRL